MVDINYTEGFGMEEKRRRAGQEERERIIKQLKEHLSRCSEIRFAYLHGSFVEDVPYKDVDIAVFYDERVPRNQQLDLCLSLAAELSHKLGVPVDIHALNDARVAFRYQATKGRVLFARDCEELFEFMEATWREYFDFKPILEENLMDMVRAG